MGAPSIKWIDTILSGNVARIGYDKDAEEMYVDFRSGGSYRYEKVSMEVWTAALNAPSIGKFLTQHIRGNYAFKKLVKSPG